MIDEKLFDAFAVVGGAGKLPCSHRLHGAARTNATAVGATLADLHR